MQLKMVDQLIFNNHVLKWRSPASVLVRNLVYLFHNKA